MGMASGARDWWAAKRQHMFVTHPTESRVSPFFIPSPLDSPDIAKQCSHEAVKAGAKAAAVASVATAIPTLIAARAVPWAKANLNYTAQALIISTVAGAAYFIVADKTILESARKNSFAQFEKVETSFQDNQKEQLYEAWNHF
eukprot:Gb_29497 [translate_table: standard]